MHTDHPTNTPINDSVWVVIADGKALPVYHQKVSGLTRQGFVFGGLEWAHLHDYMQNMEGLKEVRMKGGKKYFNLL